jgi:RNA polymerase sigma-70 factor (family 1)
MAQLAFHDENDLLNALRAGDEHAFSIIFKKYWQHLYRIAIVKVQSREVAEEIVQELLVTLWEKRNVLLINNLTHYLNASLKNRCIDHIRRNTTKEKYWQYIKSYFPVMDVQDEVNAHELEEAIEKGMAGLPEKSRMIFTLNRVEGISNSEIAKRTNLSEKSVEYHITKSLKQLKKHLKDFVVTVLALTFSNFL